MGHYREILVWRERIEFLINPENLVFFSTSGKPSGCSVMVGGHSPPIASFFVSLLVPMRLTIPVGEYYNKFALLSPLPLFFQLRIKIPLNWSYNSPINPSHRLHPQIGCG